MTNVCNIASNVRDKASVVLSRTSDAQNRASSVQNRPSDALDRAIKVKPVLLMNEIWSRFVAMSQTSEIYVLNSVAKVDTENFNNCFFIAKSIVTFFIHFFVSLFLFCFVSACKPAWELFLITNNG